MMPPPTCTATPGPSKLRARGAREASDGSGPGATSSFWLIVECSIWAALALAALRAGSELASAGAVPRGAALLLGGGAAGGVPVAGGLSDGESVPGAGGAADGVVDGVNVDGVCVGVVVAPPGVSGVPGVAAGVVVLGAVFGAGANPPGGDELGVGAVPPAGGVVGVGAVPGVVVVLFGAVPPTLGLEGSGAVPPMVGLCGNGAVPPMLGLCGAGEVAPGGSVLPVDVDARSLAPVAGGSPEVPAGEVVGPVPPVPVPDPCGSNGSLVVAPWATALATDAGTGAGWNLGGSSGPGAGGTGVPLAGCCAKAPPPPSVIAIPNAIPIAVLRTVQPSRRPSWPRYPPCWSSRRAKTAGRRP
jgi:hypothetical protein